jgi:hypothetical protein
MGSLELPLEEPFLTLMQKWEELVSVVEQVELSDDTDALVCFLLIPAIISLVIGV